MSVGLPGRVVSLSQRTLPDNTQQSQQTDIHDPTVRFEPTISADERPLGPADVKITPYKIVAGIDNRERKYKKMAKSMGGNNERSDY